MEVFLGISHCKASQQSTRQNGEIAEFLILTTQLSLPTRLSQTVLLGPQPGIPLRTLGVHLLLHLFVSSRLAKNPLGHDHTVHRGRVKEKVFKIQFWSNVQWMGWRLQVIIRHHGQKDRQPCLWTGEFTANSVIIQNWMASSSPPTSKVAIRIVVRLIAIIILRSMIEGEGRWGLYGKWCSWGRIIIARNARKEQDESFAAYQGI